MFILCFLVTRQIKVWLGLKNTIHYIVHYAPTKRNSWFKMSVPVKTVVYQLNSSRVKKGDTVNSGWDSLNIYYTDRTKIPTVMHKIMFSFTLIYFLISWIKHQWYAALCTKTYGVKTGLYILRWKRGNYETWNESKWYKLKAFGYYTNIGC